MGTRQLFAIVMATLTLVMLFPAATLYAQTNCGPGQIYGRDMSGRWDGAVDIGGTLDIRILPDATLTGFYGEIDRAAIITGYTFRDESLDIYVRHPVTREVLFQLADVHVIDRYGRALQGKYVMPSGAIAKIVDFQRAEDLPSAPMACVPYATVMRISENRGYASGK